MGANVIPISHGVQMAKDRKRDPKLPPGMTSAPPVAPSSDPPEDFDKRLSLVEHSVGELRSLVHRAIGAGALVCAAFVGALLPMYRSLGNIEGQLSRLDTTVQSMRRHPPDVQPEPIHDAGMRDVIGAASDTDAESNASATPDVLPPRAAHGSSPVASVERRRDGVDLQLADGGALRIVLLPDGGVRSQRRR